VEITWDDRKEAENIKKHGVDFDEASTVIHNPLSLYWVFRPSRPLIPIIAASKPERSDARRQLLT